MAYLMYLLFQFKIFSHMVAACWSTFGMGKTLLSTLIVKPLAALFNNVAFFLDNIFFPGYRDVKIEKPIFIIGHPRSGTTFLHRLLTQTHEFAVFEFWEILFPSLLARKIVWPIIRLLITKGKDVILPKETGHEIKLGSVEEEEYLFFHNLNTQFLSVSSPIAFGEWDFRDLVFSDEQPRRIRKKTADFLRQCLQRQIYTLGKKQVITKMNYSGMRLRSLLEAFPDAKFVYLIRSPLETIPSHLSLHRNCFDHFFGLQNIPQDRLRRYYQRRYAHNVAFYQYVESLLDAGTFSPSQLLVLPYDMLKNDLGTAVESLLAFTGLSISMELRAAIDAQIRKQGSYQRKHRIQDLEEFGLTKQKIVADLAPVFKKYGFPS